MWKTAIKIHKKLLDQRPDPSFWSDNIIDASSVLKNPEDWRIFYLYLTDGQNFNVDNPVLRETLADIEENTVIPDYLPNQKVTEVANGPQETYILVETMSEDEKADEKDDEKEFS
jgi:DNA invertase Pin-like site-specific DNA recombinase